jgi:two-component system cell cycle response regulator
MMDNQVIEILRELAAGRLPEYIPADGEYARELRALRDYHQGLLNFAGAIAIGNLSFDTRLNGGPLAGSLKALHASLRHLTWQTKQIAHGDLTQRVDFMGEFSLAFNSMVESLAEARGELLHMSTHDVMTGLYNRAYFDTEMERVAKGRKFPVSFVMADLDGLKRVNDNNGHTAGDQLIMAAANILMNSFRGDDVVARIGGDEFAVIMADCSQDGAEAVLERIRRNQEEHNLSARTAVSISLGLGTAGSGGQVAEALKIADERMYKDKALNKFSRFK